MADTKFDDNHVTTSYGRQDRFLFRGKQEEEEESEAAASDEDAVTQALHDVRIPEGALAPPSAKQRALYAKALARGGDRAEVLVFHRHVLIFF